MKKPAKLTAKRIDSIYSELLKEGAGKPVRMKVDPDAPRFTLQTKKVPRKEAIRRKKARIREAQLQLEEAQAAPLEKTEQVFVRHRPGTNKWNDAYFEQQYGHPLICSPETRRLILEGSKGKPASRKKYGAKKK